MNDLEKREQPSIPFAPKEKMEKMPEESLQVLAEVLGQMGANELPLGPKNSPCLNDLDLEPNQANDLFKAQLRCYGDTLGFPPRVWRSPASDEERGGMAHPAVQTEDAVYELLFTSLTSENDWQLVVAKSSREGVEILNLSPEELPGIISGAKPLSTEWYGKDNPVLPGKAAQKANPNIEKWMEAARRGSRTLWFGAKAVMIISNEGPDNARRSQVACGLWDILRQISINTNQKIPDLICNGPQHSVQEMKVIAQQREIPKERIKAVVLDRGEATINHITRMLRPLEGQDPIDPLPNPLIAVTSDYHLVRVFSAFQESLEREKRDILLWLFEAPSFLKLSEFEKLVSHEVEELLKHQQERLKNPPPSDWEVPLAKSVWATVAAGGSLP